MSVFTEDMALEAVNNEGFTQTFRLRNKDSAGVYTPLAGAGYTFKASLKKTRGLAATAIATFTVTKVGQTTVNGVTAFEVTISLTEAQMNAIAPGAYVYDFCGKNGTAEPETFWIAPFTVEAGLTDWP